MINFKTQYDKIVNAYLKNELRPLESCACFIGNMLGGSSEWSSIRTSKYVGNGKWTFIVANSKLKENFEESAKFVKSASKDTYILQEIVDMENLFLNTCFPIPSPSSVPTEENLYKAMEVTLLKLKEIHESKGEIIEDYQFVKRELQSVA